jgi:hypothetical protein
MIVNDNQELPNTNLDFVLGFSLLQYYLNPFQHIN